MYPKNSSVELIMAAMIRELFVKSPHSVEYVKGEEDQIARQDEE